MTDLTFSVIKVLGVSAVACVIAVLWSPILINFLYKHKLWKKTAGKKAISGGVSFKKRFLVVALIGLIGGIWFYQKLGWDIISIPLIGHFSIGILYVPLFVVVMIASWSGGK